MGNNHHNKFSLSWLYHKLTYPKTCTTSSISISKSSFRPRLKAASPDPDTRISIPRKSYYFTRELTRETLANHFLEGSLSHKSTRKTISLKKEHVEEKSGRPVSSHSLSSTSNSINCSSTMHHRPRRHSRELQFNHVFTPDPVDKANASLSSCTVNPNTMARDVMVGTVNPLGLFPMSTEKKKKKKKKVVKDTVTERSHVSSKGFYLSTSTKYPGMSIEVHSPRLLESTRGIQVRKGAVTPRRNGETNGKYEGVEVVKLTFDPWRDFRDSMAEMIVENRIKESKDLEDLLMRYLSLNSAEYHDAIIGVFKQVWCNLVDIPLN